MGGWGRWGLSGTKCLFFCFTNCYFLCHILSFCSFFMVLLVTKSHQDLPVYSGKSGNVFIFPDFPLYWTECKNSLKIFFSPRKQQFYWSARTFVSTSTPVALYKGIKSHESSGFYEMETNFWWEDKWRLGCFLNVAFPNFIFSGVCMHTFATLKVPQVDIFWWEYVTLGSAWPVLVMEETNFLLLANTFPFFTCGWW